LEFSDVCKLESNDLIELSGDEILPVSRNAVMILRGLVENGRLKMSEGPHRWYVVRYKSKEDVSQGIDYDFGEKVEESAFFPMEHAANAIQSLMSPGVVFTLVDGRKVTVYEFGVEKVDDHKYAIYTERDIPTNIMLPPHPSGESEV
jgi:hypothetical protein